MSEEERIDDYQGMSPQEQEQMRSALKEEDMKRFKNMTTSQAISDAITDAERLLSPTSSMMIDLSWKDDFKYSSGTGMDVVKNLQILRKEVPVYTYRPWNPFSAAIGYFDGKAIHINVRKLPKMNHEDIVASLLHEYMHYCSYSHGNNYKTKEKCLYSVPYWVSENVKGWL